ncbi:hypothetical protein CYMTET_7499 [Cymbomonas tetramitiformis]|uniref:Uncharacterized protein n=1 Tax=Cymbomonas tetramitiformis TaxID=36881 RepID=A0AAE0GV51_9CHLO|nr:hypothetical protein CYMTET_7499 [Cymbomonas tetramitiformis]
MSCSICKPAHVTSSNPTLRGTDLPKATRSARPNHKNHSRRIQVKKVLRAGRTSPGIFSVSTEAPNENLDKSAKSDSTLNSNPSTDASGENDTEVEEEKEVPEWLSDEVWLEGNEKEFVLFKYMRKWGEFLSMPAEDREEEVEGGADSKVKGEFGQLLDKINGVALFIFFPVWSYLMIKAFQEAL